MMAEAAEIQTTEPFGEAQALADILGWSKTRPAWQQDALRRLCEKDTLSSDDLNELYQRSLIRTHAPICACRGT